MRIELPEPVLGQQYEFIGCQLTRCVWGHFDHEMKWVVEIRLEIVARLDRGEVLEIGGEPEPVFIYKMAPRAYSYDLSTGIWNTLDWSQDAGPQEPLAR